MALTCHDEQFKGGDIVSGESSMPAYNTIALVPAKERAMQM
jgi:hypothetical protein